MAAAGAGWFLSRGRCNYYRPTPTPPHHLPLPFHCHRSSFSGARFPSHITKPFCGRRVGNYFHPSSIIRALFWDPKKTAEPQSMNFSLGDFTLTGSGLEEAPKNTTGAKKVSVSVVSSISQVSSGDWDACALEATGPEKFNPFLTHGFLSSLEESASAMRETGWLPQHIIAREECGKIIGVVPLYLKSHSYGEYVFDHSWADVYYNYGSAYYPKLQCCIPFTPVTGPRILIRNNPFKIQVFDILVSALKDLATKVVNGFLASNILQLWNNMPSLSYTQNNS